MIPIKGKSQYADDINPAYRTSACGPVTIAVILDYWFSHSPFHPNDLYKQLFTLPIGLFRFVMVYRLRRLLGPKWSVKSSNCIDEVIHELKNNRPVAAKFDQYFTGRFFSTFMYKYHWVVIIGYQIENGGVHLFFHDNGAPGRESTIRRFSYDSEAAVLRFVLIQPPVPQKNPL